jgi:hypothetical protein
LHRQTSRTNAHRATGAVSMAFEDGLQQEPKAVFSKIGRSVILDATGQRNGSRQPLILLPNSEAWSERSGYDLEGTSYGKSRDGPST